MKTWVVFLGVLISIPGLSQQSKLFINDTTGVHHFSETVWSCIWKGDTVALKETMLDVSFLVEVIQEQLQYLSENEKEEALMLMSDDQKRSMLNMNIHRTAMHEFDQVFDQWLWMSTKYTTQPKLSWIEVKSDLQEENGRPLFYNYTIDAYYLIAFDTLKCTIDDAIHGSKGWMWVEDLHLKRYSSNPEMENNEWTIDIAEPQMDGDMDVPVPPDPYMSESTEEIVEAPDMDENAIYTFAEVYPVYQGKDDYATAIAKELVLPAKKDVIKGIVYLSFVVEKDGSINDVKAEKEFASYPKMTTAAIQALNNLPARWSPAYSGGKKVRCKMVVPVQFVP